MQALVEELKDRAKKIKLGEEVLKHKKHKNLKALMERQYVKIHILN